MEKGFIVYLEDQRLQREAEREAIAEGRMLSRCQDCHALVPVRISTSPRADGSSIGECRCICGMVFEVTKESAA